MRNLLRWINLLTILSLLVFGLAMPALATKAPTEEKLLDLTLRHYVEELKQDPATQGMAVGYEVVSLDRREVLAGLRTEKTFVPGAPLQLLLSATVLDRLPENMRIPTELYVDGRLTPSGVLHGDVVLKGYGDPSLQTKDLDQLARALRKEGVRKVQGNIVVDDTFFDNVRLGDSWMWDDEPFPFSAQIGALSVDGNTVSVKVEPSRVGKPPQVSVTPAKEYVRVVNQAKTVPGKEESLKIDRTLGKNELVIRGTIGVKHQGVREGRTVEEPDRFTGFVLKEQLKKRGVTFHPHSKVVPGSKREGAKRIGRRGIPSIGPAAAASGLGG